MQEKNDMKNKRKKGKKILALFLVFLLVSGTWNPSGVWNVYAQEDTVSLSETETQSETVTEQSLENNSPETESEDGVLTEAETETTESTEDTTETVTENTETLLMEETLIVEESNLFAAQKSAVSTIMDWQWTGEIDALEIQQDEETGVWGLGLPGVTIDNQADFDTVVSMLPASITATVTDTLSTEDVSITWNCDAYVQDENGNWPVNGDYIFQAELPEGYSLSEDAEKLEVTVQLGEAEGYLTPANDGYYYISSAEDLIAFANLVNGGQKSSNAKLTKDIDMSGKDWTPIGNVEDYAYAGTFDGDGFSITNISCSGNSQIAIFGVNYKGTIENLGVTGEFSGNDFVAGICASNYYGRIANCWNGAKITSSEQGAGIVVGNYMGIISNCYNVGEINALNSAKNDMYSGGIVGYSDGYGSVENCFNFGSVGTDVAAIVGGNVGNLENCYYLADAEISGTAGAFKTAEQFKSGEVAWLLNGESSEVVWKQSLTSDNYPTLDSTHGTVYKYGGIYSNTILSKAEDGYYEISTADGLLIFASLVNGGQKTINARLTKDIDMSGKDWTPIGNSEDISYAGTFDGGGFCINEIRCSSGESIAIFNSNIGTIKNVGVTGEFSGSYIVAGICVVNSGGTIENCWNGVNITATGMGVGIAVSNIGTVRNCYNIGKIKSSMGAGIVGYNSGTVENCFNYSTDEDTAKNIVGVNFGAGTLNNCYYLADDEISKILGTFKTADQFKSGEVAWLLNSSTSEGVWKQTLNSDDYPTLDSSRGTVYNNNGSYSNTILSQAEDGYYEISTAEELLIFAALVNGGQMTINARLTGNIDMSGKDWTPIGNGNAYAGTFDGQGFCIKNINCSGKNIGLFKSNHADGTIQNVGVTGEFLGEDSAAGICVTNSGTIENCWNGAKNTADGEDAGIAVYNSGIINNCYNIGMVKEIYDGEYYAYFSGGIVCENDYGMVKNCFNYSSGEGSARNVVGISLGNMVENCYYLADAEISGTDGILKTADQFASGEVAWLLNGESSEVVWKQTLASDKYPTLDSTHGTVYNYDGIYSNLSKAEDGYYYISSADELNAFANLVNTGSTNINAKLTQNIDMSGKSWTPIGTAVEKDNKYDPRDYCGTFDGRGYYIKLSISEGGDKIGIFGVTGSSSKITNLGVTGTISGRNNVSGICVQNLGTIENCWNGAQITASNWMCAGIVAYNVSGTISNCYNIGTITSNITSDSGGIVGYHVGGTVTNCFNYGKVDGKAVGDDVTNCYYLGNSGSGGGGTSKTADAFKSGEVAWLLNGSISEGVWKQTLASDKYPTLDSTHGTVYNYDGSYSNIQKETQKAPSMLPTATVTSNSITIGTQTSTVATTTQYACIEGTANPENSDWKDSNIFTSLQSATKYTCYVRFAASDNYLASDSVSQVFYTAAATPNANVATISYTDETISFGNTYEVNTSDSFNGTTITSGVSITDYIAANGSTPQKLYIRVKAVENGAPASAATEITIPAKPDTPSAQVTETTASTISLTNNTAWEYSTNQSTWNGTYQFSNLGANQSKTYYVRVKATDTSFKSAVQTVSATTNAASYHIIIPSKATAGGDTVNVTVNSNKTFDLGYKGQVHVKANYGDGYNINNAGILTLTRKDATDTITSQMYQGAVAFAELTKDLAVFTTNNKEGVAVKFGTPFYNGGTIPAGDYSGTVTFQITYDEQQ